jgi:putative membrane protein
VNWSVLIGLLAVQTGYLLATGAWRRRFAAANGGVVPPPVGRGRQAVFVAGVLTLGLALASPLDALVALLQSAHMVQHLLLTLIAPPLLLLGTPGWLLRPALRWPGVARLALRVTRAKLAFAIGNVVFVAWHIPAFYDLALRFEPVHILEHLSMLATALVLWWPVVGMLPELPSLSRPAQLLYVALQTLPGALVGIILGMAEAPLYPTYVAAPRLWGVPVLMDQQISGLIMWVGSNFFWLGVLTAVFFAWHAREEAEERAAAAVARADDGARAENNHERIARHPA